jgi:hypothetical protein
MENPARNVIHATQPGVKKQRGKTINGVRQMSIKLKGRRRISPSYSVLKV